MDQRTISFLDSINTLAVTGRKGEPLRLDSASVSEPEIPVFDKDTKIASDLDTTSNSTVATQSALISQGEDDSSCGFGFLSNCVVFIVSCLHRRRMMQTLPLFLALI